VIEKYLSTQDELIGQAAAPDSSRQHQIQMTHQRPLAEDERLNEFASVGHHGLRVQLQQLL
jgi:hypothetical protein